MKNGDEKQTQTKISLTGSDCLFAPARIERVSLLEYRLAIERLSIISKLHKIADLNKMGAQRVLYLDELLQSITDTEDQLRLRSSRDRLAKELQDDFFREIEDTYKKELKEIDEFYLESAEITKYISFENLWKLGVDAQDHPRGRLAYDQGKNTYKIAEPGYIDAMETALAFMFKTVDTPITPTFVKRLHFLCCAIVTLNTGVDCYCYQKSSEESKQDEGSPFFNNEEGGCRLVTNMMTKEGLREMIEYDFFQATLISYSSPKGIVVTRDNFNQCWKDIQEFKNKESNSNDIYFTVGKGGIKKNQDKNTVLSNIIKEYNENIRKAVVDDDRILAIATCAKKIECAHFFRDGNLRMVRLLVIKLLIQNNLPLTCIPDPNIIDGHSSEQVAKAIKDGMEIYKKLKLPSDSVFSKPNYFII